ncbi:hypothetical protein [Clostridium saccharoperbutylacetonicum]|uniref:hypothetical protein n=1 Tax=Clostridium saccharoperbutylacetonicum TaxID=36745 RepID=UPI0039E9FB82
MNKLYEYILKFIITFATLLITVIIAKYFDFDTTSAVCIGFIDSTFNDIIIDVAGVKNE